MQRHQEPLGKTPDSGHFYIYEIQRVKHMFLHSIALFYSINHKIITKVVTPRIKVVTPRSISQLLKYMYIFPCYGLL